MDAGIQLDPENPASKPPQARRKECCKKPKAQDCRRMPKEVGWSKLVSTKQKLSQGGSTAAGGGDFRAIGKIKGDCGKPESVVHMINTVRNALMQRMIRKAGSP